MAERDESELKPVYLLFCVCERRLILTAVLVASKMYNDTYYTNRYIAQVGGVTLNNINELERHFIEICDWHLYVSPEEFELYERALITYQQVEQSQQLQQMSQLQLQQYASSLGHSQPTSPVPIQVGSPGLSDHSYGGLAMTPTRGIVQVQDH